MILSCYFQMQHKLCYHSRQYNNTWLHVRMTQYQQKLCVGGGGEQNQISQLITITVLHNVRPCSPIASQKAVIFTTISCELCISDCSDYYCLAK